MKHNWHRVLSRDDGAPDIITTNRRCEACCIRAHNGWDHWPAVEVSECVAAAKEPERVRLPLQLGMSADDIAEGVSDQFQIRKAINRLIAFLEQEQSDKEALPEEITVDGIENWGHAPRVRVFASMLNEILRYLKGGER